MNGNDKKLALDYFELWREQHDNTAQEVRKDVKYIINKLNNLPCEAHSTANKYHWLAITGLYIFLTAILSGWLKP